MPPARKRKPRAKQPIPLPPTSRRRPVPAPATDQPPLFRTMFKRASSAAWSVESRPRAPARRAPGARETPAVRRCTTRRSAVAAAHRRRRASGAEAPPLERRSRSRSAASGALGCGCLCESPTLSLTVCVLWRASGRSEPRFVSVGVWLHLSVTVSQIKRFKKQQRSEPSVTLVFAPSPHGMEAAPQAAYKNTSVDSGDSDNESRHPAAPLSHHTPRTRRPEAAVCCPLLHCTHPCTARGAGRARRRPRAQSGRERAARRPLRSSARLGACAPCRGRSGGQRGRGCCRSRT